MSSFTQNIFVAVLQSFHCLSEPEVNSRSIKEAFREAGQPDLVAPTPERSTRSVQKGRHETEIPMTLASFEHLAGTLNAVRRLCPDLAVLAIQWMHPKHPIHPAQEKLMRGEGMITGGAAKGGWVRRWGNNLRAAGELLLHLGWCMVHATYLSLVLMRLRWYLRLEIDVLKRQRFDLIAKTWCFGADRATDDRDFYYGDLQRRLAERGVRMLLLCGDVNDTDWRAFARAYISTSNLCRVPELCLVHPLAPIWMALKQLLTSLRLHRLAARAGEPLIRQVCRLASRDCLSPHVTYNGLFFWIGRTAVQTWHPRAFMTLYEGHGWEKCAWWGAKTADESCKTVGYQHTVLFRESLSLTRPYLDIRERSVPDVVLSLGPATLELMRNGHERHRSRILCFGSFRHLGSGVTRPVDPARRIVLVTPEGLTTEVKTIFTFAYECAQRLPSYLFVLRLHPQFSLAEALKILPPDVMKQPNIVISDKRIEEDFNRASVLLYRGSSSVLYAILNGLFPIYLHVDSMIDTDPLYELKSWRKLCTTVDGFKGLLEEYERTPAGRLEDEWRVAANYVRNYTMPVVEERVEQFLMAVGINTNGDK
jgi:hypothetical protein